MGVCCAVPTCGQRPQILHSMALTQHVDESESGSEAGDAHLYHKLQFVKQREEINRGNMSYVSRAVSWQSINSW